MKKFLFLLILINFFSIKSQAQTKELDSLLVLLQNHQVEDTIRVNLLNKIAKRYYPVYLDESFEKAEQANKLSKKLKFTKGKGQSFSRLGDFYKGKFNYQKALKYFDSSITNHKEINYKRGISINYNKIANTYKFMNNNQKAFDYYNKSIILNNEINNIKGSSYTFFNMATLFLNQGDYLNAMEHCQKAIELGEKIDDKKVQAYSYNTMGNIFGSQKEYQKALIYYQKALLLNEDRNDLRALSFNYNNLGIVYNNLSEDSNSLMYHQKAISIGEKQNNKRLLSTSYNNIGSIYNKQKDYSKALENYQNSLKISIEINNRTVEGAAYEGLGKMNFNQGNLKEAYHFGKKAYALANDIQNPILILDSSKLLAESGEALGYYKEAYMYQVIHKKMNDSLNKAENIKKITSLEFQYKYEKDRQLEVQEQQKLEAINAEELKKQKVLRNSLIVSFLLLLIIFSILYRNFIQKSKANAILIKQKQEIQSQAKELHLRNGNLKNLNATKDKFFSIISHDLKNPFNTLLGMSNLLLDDDKNYNKRERKEYLQHINDSTSKTYKLLENLLIWSKSQTGMIKYVPKKIKLKPLVEELVLLFKETSEIKGIKIQQALDKSLKVYGDKNMLNTILRNLISNATKFTPKGGEIFIKAGLYEKDPFFIKIAIQDTGVGIPKEIQEKLFSICDHIITNGTEDETGSGLGLILCKEFVEKQGGEIWLESEEEKGTIVYFTLPKELIEFNIIKETVNEKLV